MKRCRLLAMLLLMGSCATPPASHKETKGPGWTAHDSWEEAAAGLEKPPVAAQAPAGPGPGMAAPDAPGKPDVPSGHPVGARTLATGLAERGGVGTTAGFAPPKGGKAPGGTDKTLKRADRKYDAAADGLDVETTGGPPGRGEPVAAPAGAPVPTRRGGSPGVKAGFADDNREFGAYLAYLEKFRGDTLLPLDVSGRIVFEVRAGQGKPAPFATLTFRDAHREVIARRTAYADGRTLWFPTESARFGAPGVTVEAAWRGATAKAVVEPQGRRTVTLDLDAEPRRPKRVPVDVCFLLDTTGSMGDEIQRLKDTIHAVHAALTGLPEKPDLRLGMVLYRDRKDAYVTRKVPFTADVQTFAAALNPVGADGGGDYPEDLQEGLRVALQELAWRDGAVKVIFVLTDAPPHVYPDQVVNYLDAARGAATLGIKIVGVGASGLTSPGEAALRQMAQYTMGQFVFLTYGESGESEGGTATSVSHHTGENFQTRNLDAIIVRFVRGELAALEGRALAEDDWMEAGPAQPGEDRDAVLAKLFDEGVRRLLDYAMVPVPARTPVAVLPVTAPADWRAAAERVESQLLLAVARHAAFMLVERSKDLRQILAEQAVGLTGVVAEADAARVGKLVGATLLVVSRLTPGEGRPEVLMKLVRVETAEVLAVSLVKSDESLLR